MRTFFLLALVAFAVCKDDFLVELEATATPLPVVKCLIASDKIRKDVVIVVDAVKQFIEDKNAFLLITKILGVYPEVEAEVKRCLEAEGINLKGIEDLPAALKKIWKSIPKNIRDEIIKHAKHFGKEAAKKVCKKLLKLFKKGTEICDHF